MIVEHWSSALSTWLKPLSVAGYYYHAASGYYYDANSGLYFDSSDQKWKRYDPETGQYVPVEEPESTESAAQAAIGRSLRTFAPGALSVQGEATA